MDIKTKRKYKKRSKISYNLAFVFVGMLFLNFTLFITHAFGLDARVINSVLVISIMFSPLLFAIVCWFFAMLYYDKFMRHHIKVKQWRGNNIVSKIIKFELGNNHKRAIDLYNSLPTCSDKDMLFTFIITNSMHSDEPKRKKEAELKFKMYQDWYKTSNIDFN